MENTAAVQLDVETMEGPIYTTSVEQANPDWERSTSEYLVNALENLELDEKERQEILENGFSPTNVVKDIFRENLLNILTQVFQLDLNTSVDAEQRRENLKWRLGNPSNQELEQIYLIRKYWTTPEKLPTKIQERLPQLHSQIQNLRQKLEAYISEQFMTHLGEEGKQLIFNYQLSQESLIKMIASAGRRNGIAASPKTTRKTHPATTENERELVEQQNLLWLKELSKTENLSQGNKMIIEVSPPVHKHQKDLMLRMYSLIDGVWQARIITLPYSRGEMGDKSGLERAAALQQKIRKLAVQAHISHSNINSHPSSGKEENQVLQTLTEIRMADSFDPDNIAQLLTWAYNEDLKYSDLVESSEAAAKKVSAVMNQLLSAPNSHSEKKEPGFLESLRDKIWQTPGKWFREEQAGRIMQILQLNVAANMTDAELQDNGWTKQDITNLRETGLSLGIQSATKGQADEYINQISGGKSIASSSTSECGGSSFTLGKRNEVAKVIHSQSIDNTQIKDKTTEGGLTWGKLNNEDVVMCPECASKGKTSWVVPCVGYCDGCNSSADTLYKKYEQGRYSEGRNQATQAGFQRTKQAGIGTAIGKFFSHIFDALGGKPNAATAEG